MKEKGRFLSKWSRLRHLFLNLYIYESTNLFKLIRRIIVEANKLRYKIDNKKGDWDEHNKKFNNKIIF